MEEVISSEWRLLQAKNEEKKENALEQEHKHNVRDIYPFKSGASQLYTHSTEYMKSSCILSYYKIIITITAHVHIKSIVETTISGERE